MIYPVSLISKLLQDLDKASVIMWYCSLDMASEFWVVEMTERTRAISAFVTRSGLFNWLPMPFGVKKAPQIYQRLIDNALYEYLKIGSTHNSSTTTSSTLTDVFTDRVPDSDPRPSVLGRRSCIDEILIPAMSWISLYTKVGRLLEVCSMGFID